MQKCNFPVPVLITSKAVNYQTKGQGVSIRHFSRLTMVESTSVSTEKNAQIIKNSHRNDFFLKLKNDYVFYVSKGTTQRNNV